MEIDDQEIGEVESLLLPEGEGFDDDRRKIVKDLSGFDVQASPGSGKTTTLLAKLLLLARRLPFDKNQGICVLTHTNVAVNEIQDRLGTHFSKLFNYPNFFGTFQSFVHRYISNQIFIQEYGVKPKIIENNYFNRLLANKLGTFPWKHETSLRKYIYRQKKERKISLDELASRFYYNFGEESFKIIERNGKHTTILSDKTNTKYPHLKKIFNDIYSQGVVRFSDPYYLSLKHIQAKEATYRNLLTKRFKLVLVDEMQDTDLNQCRLLDKLFDTNQTSIQRFGDVNQSIFQNSVHEDVFWEINDREHSISGSKRFHHSIAKRLHPIGVKKFEVSGVEVTPNIPPHIILFDDESIEEVKDEFIKLIQENGLNETKLNTGNPFKAIGWVKEHDDYHGISSYWPEVTFEQKGLKRVFYNNMYCYIESLKFPGTELNMDANSIRKTLVDATVQFTRELDIRNENGKYFNPRSFMRFVESEDEDLFNTYLFNLATCCKKVVLGKEILRDFRFFFLSFFPPLFGIGASEVARSDFLCSNELDKRVKQASVEGGNVYFKDDIEIEFSTIHGIKGETHTGTLYLETFYDGYDLHRIKDLLVIEKHTSTSNNLEIKTRKMAYVAMSRPTHLLCLAMHKKTLGRGKKGIEISSDYQNRLDKKWEIVEV